MKATFLALILIGLTPFVPLSAQYPDYREGPDFMPGELDTLKKLMIPLPWANREINEVNDFIDGRTYHGEIATEDHFRGVAPGFGILHLATHTFLNDDRPLYSKMVFSPDSIHDRDGFLNTYEVAQLALQAELAVLSACNTGYGDSRNGEGILSLSRAFQLAGCPTMMASLWPASDRSTSGIMNRFYNNLIAGMDKDEALRMAKLQYIEAVDDPLAAPFFWANTIAIGDFNDVYIERFMEERYLRENRQIWLYSSALGLPLALLLIGAFLRRGRRQRPQIGPKAFVNRS